jgi:hypothetical protein
LTFQTSGFNPSFKGRIIAIPLDSEFEARIVLTNETPDTICLQKSTYKKVLTLAVDAECSKVELEAAKIDLQLANDKIQRKNTWMKAEAIAVVILGIIVILK